MPSHSVSHVLMLGPREPKGEPRLWPRHFQAADTWGAADAPGTSSPWGLGYISLVAGTRVVLAPLQQPLCILAGSRPLWPSGLDL